MHLETIIYYAGDIAYTESLQMCLSGDEEYIQTKWKFNVAYIGKM